ncbi:MAG: PilZ domain-containing protein [Nitrospirota bacterium]|nr:MAG: PilZ domain-containing protein [Nitrospirota bacterium]
MPETKERRDEQRYPIQEIYRKYVSCKIKLDGAEAVDAQLIEFSKSGLKIMCKSHKEENSVLECVISLPKLYPKDLKTRIKVRYSTPSENSDNFIIGAKIIEADKDYIARVFAKIIEFVTLRTGNLY